MRPEEIVLGIDLGTSFSTASAWIDGKLHFVLDGRGEACVPSVVFFPKSGAPLIGAEADKMRTQDPSNTVAGIKRLLGRKADDGATRIFEASSAAKLSRGANGALSLAIRGTDYVPSSIASMILSHLRERAQMKFGRPVNKAVITVPATASQAMREDTLRAGRAAGLDVLELLAEPIAGAIALGLDGLSGDRRLMVFDFGGGTFDVTIVEQTDKQLRVDATGGDDLLGGDDFDQALAKRIASVVYHAYKADLLHDVVRRDRVHRACERVKRALSTVPQTPMRVPDAFTSGGRPHDLELLVSRAEADPVWADLVERSVKISAETMVQAGVRPSDLAGIVLVGGTTHIPLVRDRVSRVFARPCAQARDPQTAVSTGAALLGARAIAVAMGGRPEVGPQAAQNAVEPRIRMP